jgi:hypothetical protein
MDHAEEVLQGMFPAYGETTEVLEPGKETFYLPATAIATEGAPLVS